MPREFDKLGRDKIPDVIEEKGEEPTIHIADDEYSDRLIEKMEEEVTEYRESGELDELADVLEVVVHAIRKDRGIAREEFQEIRARKAEQRGRFDDRIVLDRVEK